jgi:DNA-binding transcriptional LysR family regulator
MNVHHLELFYYVARHGGVSAAARRIPYGIQQPAISAQIIQLENYLGVTLFQRRPFGLTPAGGELYRFIEPFFQGIEGMAKQLRGATEVSIRIAAPEVIQQQYLPSLIRRMRERSPGLRVSLMPAGSEKIEKLLLAQEVDLGIGPIVGRPAEGIKCKVLLRAPMALLVSRRTKIASAEALWRRDPITESLITGTAHGLVSRIFQAELLKRKLEWFPSMELDSQQLISHYVSEGFGVGLIVVEPGGPPPPGLRLLPLPGFPTIPYGLLWVGALTPLQQGFLKEAEALAAPYRERAGGEGAGL